MVQENGLSGQLSETLSHNEPTGISVVVHVTSMREGPGFNSPDPFPPYSSYCYHLYVCMFNLKEAGSLHFWELQVGRTRSSYFLGTA